MIKKKIIQAFERNPDLQYLFLFDGSGQYTEEMAQEVEEYKVIRIDTPLYFQLKTKVEKQTRSAVVLYHTYSRPVGEAFNQYPLLGLYYANEELLLDEVAAFIERYALSEKHRSLIKKYQQNLSKTTQNKIIKILTEDELTEPALQRGLISVAMDLNTVVDKSAILMRYLSVATDKAILKKIHKRLSDMQLDTVLIKWIDEVFDMPIAELTDHIPSEIATKVKYNIMMQDVSVRSAQDTYTRLRAHSTVSLNRITAFFQEWSEDLKYRSNIDSVMRHLAHTVKEESLWSWYGPEVNYGYMTAPMWTAMLDHLIQSSDTDLNSYDSLLIRTDLPLDEKNVLLFLRGLTELKQAISASSCTLYESPDEFIERYASHDYIIDKCYRQAHMSYKNVGLFHQSKVQALYDDMHQRYNKYLIAQNTSWQNCLDRIQFDYSQIAAHKQYQFYRDHIENFDYKGAVIISDAFRYDLAVELSERLLTDDKLTIEIDPYLASVPSFTQMGMSNLLPHNSIEVETANDGFLLKINKLSTGSQNRERILQMDKPNARAVQFKQLNEWTLPEGRAFFIEHRLAYIYHNHVDAAGDKQQLEHYTFDACEKAISELYDLVKKLYNWNVYYIFITADHGFLYNHKALGDHDKEDMPKGKTNYYQDTRCCIVDELTSEPSGYQFPLRNTTNIDSDLQVIIPKAVNRYRKQGNISFKFDHGGASLQELVVPVFKLYKKDTKVRDQVTFRRIDKNDKITSTIKVTILQNEPVSSDMKSRTISIGLYSIQNDLISNEEQFILDSTQRNATGRTFYRVLSLTAEGSKQSQCYLRAFDSSDTNKMNPIGINDTLSIESIYEKDEF